MMPFVTMRTKDPEHIFADWIRMNMTTDTTFLRVGLGAAHMIHRRVILLRTSLGRLSRHLIVVSCVVVPEGTCEVDSFLR